MLLPDVHIVQLIEGILRDGCVLGGFEWLGRELLEDHTVALVEETANEHRLV